MAWTAPQITRDLKPLTTPTGDERTLMDGWLDVQREILLWKCGGLTAEQLALQPIEPSNLSLLGLVRHLAEVERDWFRTRFAGEQVGYLYCTDDDLTAEFDLETADAERDLAVYRREVELCRQVTSRHSLDTTYMDPNRKVEMSLRWVYTAMLQEYARHNGHADLLRERIDGATGH
ncbi:DinB family protein [Actinomadura rubrisoli]|uniref:DinB family protein n=1 Tax=Actinomadura rubrisoli TaxID=2530368 RepID=A0A4R5ANL7_9ACTN|nr:DinB family protein [Actinomadura rubrisoli]TDD73665.1 DinB family protein [Actinomadura rubrisoli]